MEIIKKILHIISAIVFFAVFVFGTYMQIYALLTKGANRETLWIVSTIIFYIFTAAIFFGKDIIRRLVNWIPIEFNRFIIIGIISSIVAESVYIFSKPFNENLVLDLTALLPFYIIWMAIWYLVIKIGDFSLTEIFFLAGINGFFVEIIFSGFVIINPISWTVISFPLVVTLYGCIMLIPAYVVKEDIQIFSVDGIIKKSLLSILPLASYVVSLFWIAYIKTIGIL